jgi:phosphoesterase RecJ-like protein
MTSEKKVLQRIVEAIKKSTTFFIAGHLKPDGDTVGSALALASLLKRLKKKAYVYSGEPLPDFLTFLKGSDRIIVTSKATREFDCAIILECADLDRMGNLISSEQAALIVNIDHHAHFSNFGDINYVNPGASSSAEQVYYLFKHMKMPFTINEAEALYTGLVTDTGKFQQANTTPSALLMAADLLTVGLEPARLYDKLYATQPLSSLNLLGLALNTLKTAQSGKIAYLEITRAMYRRAHSNVTETEGIINYCMMMPGVCVGILFRETEVPGIIKVSFRSRNSFDVNKVSKHFGGGGHRNAAGCSINGTMAIAKERVLGYVSDILKKKR